MVWLLTGCFLFISSDEHQQRLAGLSEDTSTPTDTSQPEDSGDTSDPIDTGDPVEKHPYAGTYDGPVSITIHTAGSPTCEGELDITVSYSGAITGGGSCPFTEFPVNDLKLEMTGQAEGEKATGQLIIGAKEKEDWSALFYTSRHITIFQGEFAGVLNFQDQSMDYSGTFQLD